MKRTKMVTIYNERTGQTKDQRQRMKDTRQKDHRYQRKGNGKGKGCVRSHIRCISVEGVEIHQPESQAVALME